MSCRSDLPEVLARIAKARGEVAALRVAFFYGGLEIYVPTSKHLAAGHHLVETLGRDLALALPEIFGVGRLTIPIGPVRQSSNRLGEIPPDLRQASHAEVARALGVHMRSVRRARARERQSQGSNSSHGR